MTGSRRRVTATPSPVRGRILPLVNRGGRIAVVSPAMDGNNRCGSTDLGPALVNNYYNYAVAQRLELVHWDQHYDELLPLAKPLPAG